MPDMTRYSTRELGYRMPAESAPHRCCWLAWPADHPQSPGLAVLAPGGGGIYCITQQQPA